MMVVQSSASTSTTPWLGLLTTGWVSPSPRCKACRDTWPRNLGRTASAAIWLRPVQCARWPLSQFLVSQSLKTSGMDERHSAGMSTTQSRLHGPSSRCCPTGSPRPRVKSSTSTAASTQLACRATPSSRCTSARFND